MKPIKFKQVNAEFAKDQDQYQTLPAFKLNNKDGDVVFCWKANIFERIYILFTGKVWVCLKAFNMPLTPSLVAAFRWNIFSLPKDGEFWIFLSKILTKK